jgi:beta-glucanase (GH16 family)
MSFNHRFFRLYFLAVSFFLLSCSEVDTKSLQDDSIISQPTISLDDAITINSKLKMAWNDEFTDSSLNLDKWDFQIGNGVNGWGNNELQFYTSNQNNYELSEGLLKIVPLYDPSHEQIYTSSKLVTKNKFNFKSPGIISIKFKVPQGQGLWPAIWMMPTDSMFGGWPRSGEIDLMESRGSNSQQVLSTLHYFQNGHKFQGGYHNESRATNFNEVFHNIDLVWNKEKISFYIDKKHLVFEDSLNSALGDMYPFNEDFYLILNVAIGGSFVQEPIPGEICSPSACDDSQKMIIDYVRYYSNKD